MTMFRKFKLGCKMLLNTIHTSAATSYKSHLVMALKILEIPPDVTGDVIECGTWKGGSAVNLSLVCKIVGRKLIIYDSFEGLPEGEPGDRQAKGYKKGDFCGTLEEVRKNIERYGAIQCCVLIKGWFEDTLVRLNAPVLLAFIDVDLESSLDTCVRCIWPNLTDGGYIFIDEFISTDYCSLFFSEKYWDKYFNRKPPGLIGAGSGVSVGNYYVGPLSEKSDYTYHLAEGVAYTRKDMSGHWTYYKE